MESCHESQGVTLNEDDLHQLETELAALLKARSGIDQQIAEIERDIERLKLPSSFDSTQLFKEEMLPDILEEPKDALRIVRKSSSVEVKYSLFVSLFAGRPDVHARRFQRKDGTGGYSPVCANRFNSSFCQMSAKVKGNANCISCSHQDFPPITIEAFKAHLQGNDERCCDVLGAYPIDGGDLCSFIVADFDGKKKAGDDTASNDVVSAADGRRAADAARSFRQICLKNRIPVYLEVSRSGQGYHVWLFFTEPVPALNARRLFTKLWTMTMDEYPSLDFSVYDRFIPCQDMLSSHGLQGNLGNLIALPFQGKAGKQKWTSFLDCRLIIYPDQWEFLSRIKRLSADDLDAAIKRLAAVSDLGVLVINEDDESQQKPWEKRKPLPKLQATDFSGVVEIVYANMLHVHKATLSPRAQNRIRRLAAFSNPEFYRKQRMRQSVHDVPRVISTHQEDEEFLSIPRGAQKALTKLLDDAGARYKVTDMTNPGEPLEVEFLVNLRDEQPQAAKALLEHNTGVLTATPAFGKTVVAASVIASRKTNTLVLVRNQQLLKQWKASLGSFLKIANEPPERLTPTSRKKKVDVIGEYSSTKKSLSGLVDIAMFQSLFKQGEVKDFIKDYGMVIVDEVHHVPADSFEAVLQHVNARYVYGLTATPSRKDGRTPIIFMECGPIRYSTDAKEQAEKRPFEHYVIPRFTSFYRTSTHDEKNFTALLGDIVSDAERNRMITDDVIAALENGRKPIILTDRTDHVSALAQLLENSCENVITLLGKQSAKERHEANDRLLNLETNAQFVIIATGQFVGEGFDYPRLDTLFLTVPISWQGRIAQYAGRLHRVYEGKNDVCIYDYVDASIPVLDGMYHKRIRGYKSIGYKALTTFDADHRAEDESIIFGKDEYWPVFQQDCESAKKEVAIASPHLAMYQVRRVLDTLAASILEDAAITVFTLPLDEQSEIARSAAEPCIALMEKQGVKVIPKPGLHQRIAIIDQEVVWYGSLNLLGNAMKSDNLMRLQDPKIAKRLLLSLNL